MKIAKNRVVTVDLLVIDGEGQLLESGEAGGPLDYLQGTGFLLPAVESSLEGQEAGAEIELRLTPEQAFGTRDDRLIKRLPATSFQHSFLPLQVGETVSLDQEEIREWVIIEIGKDWIVLDGNHPWSGKTLLIRIRVIAVRAASGRELWAGRVLEEESLPAGAGTCGPGCQC